MYFLGYDIGSSSIKAALVHAETGATVSSTQYPKTEMEMLAKQSGWAEQQPEHWWAFVCQATKELLQQTAISPDAIQAIGIGYQMHGLVLVDEAQQVLRPSIIWCDSRAVDIGNQAFINIGEEKCLTHLLNSPGNFTASKLKWVQDNEPQIYEKIHKMMLPGDYIAMRLTGEIFTTPSGLSEGILWDFQQNEVADFVLDYFKIDKNLIPTILPTFSQQGTVTAAAAEATGLRVGIPITYRAGDQPNNALALNVLQPGEVAATGGTSGVVYSVVDKPLYDTQSRVNGFAHVNHTARAPRIGTLLCVNGAGIQYNWIRQNVAGEAISYPQMEQAAQSIPVGADGVRILPFGNGAERIFCNQTVGGHIHNLNFNRHHQAHLYRAALEGIAFAFVYGMDILQTMGLKTNVMRVGNDNLFQSDIFSKTIATLVNCEINVIETSGAAGAARGAGVALGKSDFSQLTTLKTYEPAKEKDLYQIAYQAWRADLELLLN